MYYKIVYLLFKLKMIEPSQHAMSFWEKNTQVKKLEFALIHGHYNTRLMAANALGDIGSPSSIPVLLKRIDDKVQNVSIAVLNALEGFEQSNNFIKIIIKKRFNWANKVREANAKYETNKNKKYTIYRWERASKKSFDRVKEQLKRPMR